MQDNERFGLSRDELFATLIALVAGLLMMLGLFRCTPVWNALGFGDGDEEGGVVAVLSESIPEVDAQTGAVDSTRTDAELAALRADRDKERQRIEDLEDALQNQGGAVVTDTNEVDALRNRLNQTTGQVNSLRGDNQDMAAAAAAERKRLQDELAEQKRLAAEEAARLQKENDALRMKAEKAEAEKVAIAARIAEAKKTADAADARAAREAKAARDAAAAAKQAEMEMAAEKARIEAARARRQAGQLFAAEEDLAPKARALGTDLRKVHSGAGDLGTVPVGDAYATVSDSHDGRLIQRVAFNSGESGIGSDAAKVLAEAVAKADNKAYFVVVGYADTTGTDEINRKISEQRAMSVAEALESVPGAADRLQAFYIGSTERFSTTDLSQNRVVEIWEVAR